MSASSANRSARLDLPYLLPAQAQKHVTHNEALLRLDQLCQLVLEAAEVSDPPAAPDNGAAYGLAATPNGAWAGQGGKPVCPKSAGGPGGAILAVCRSGTAAPGRWPKQKNVPGLA
jgi:hypothetical protein